MTLALARIFFVQLLRDRIFQLAIVFVFVLIALNLVLAQLAIASQIRIYINFGLSLIHVVSVCMAVFLTVAGFHRELANRFLHVLLVRSPSRETYLFGFFCGLASVLFVLVAFFAFSLHLLFLTGQETGFYLAYYVAILGIYLEVVFAIAASLFFALVLSYPVAIATSLSLVALGHWMSNFRFFLNSAESTSYKFFGEALYWLVPHLERVNFRSWPILLDKFDLNTAFWGGIQISAYAIVFLSLSYIAFRHRDLH